MRQLGIQAVLCHQHQVGHPSQHDTAAHILLRTDNVTFCSGCDCDILKLFVPFDILEPFIRFPSLSTQKLLGLHKHKPAALYQHTGMYTVFSCSAHILINII